MSSFDSANPPTGRPESIIGIHHVQVTVPEDALPAAKAFYCGLLGLTQVEKPIELANRQVFWVRVGNQNVHIGIDQSADRSSSRAHVAYEVVDLDRWEAYLASHQIAIERPTAFAGHERFHFRDPFGNMIELIQRTSA